MTPIESMTLQKLLKQRDDMEDQREQAEAKLGKIHDDLEQLHDRMVAKLNEDNPGLGITRVSEFWDCDLSPVGMCAYNEDEDPCRDDCVFCHDPEERK